MQFGPVFRRCIHRCIRTREPTVNRALTHVRSVRSVSTKRSHSPALEAFRDAQRNARHDRNSSVKHKFNSFLRHVQDIDSSVDDLDSSLQRQQEQLGLSLEQIGGKHILQLPRSKHGHRGSCVYDPQPKHKDDSDAGGDTRFVVAFTDGDRHAGHFLFECRVRRGSGIFVDTVKVAFDDNDDWIADSSPSESLKFKDLHSDVRESTLHFLHENGLTVEVGDFIRDHADFCWQMEYSLWLDGMHDLTTPTEAVSVGDETQSWDDFQH